MRSRPALLVGIVVLLLTSLGAGRVLAAFEWDPTVFVGFGEDDPLPRQYAEDLLGDITLRPAQGHDGKFFFIQANDPWVLNPEENAALIYDPLYRSQRMFYPVIVGGAGLFGPQMVVWAMLVVNLLALAVGSWIVASMARSMGATVWWGLAFGFNPGFLYELVIGGSGIVAGAAVFGGLAVLMRGDRGWAVALLTVAALSREVMLVSAVGVAFVLWRKGETRSAVISFAVPFGAVALWAAYLRVRIDAARDIGDVGAFALPLKGLVGAFQAWIGDPIDLAIGVVTLVILGLFIKDWIKSNHLIGWAFIGFIPLMAIASQRIWENSFDYWRAVAPLLTGYLLLAFVLPHQEEAERVRWTAAVPGG